jgi:hypothetical protein
MVNASCLKGSPTYNTGEMVGRFDIMEEIGLELISIILLLKNVNPVEKEGIFYCSRNVGLGLGLNTSK